jgi:hypothetical protein
MTVNSQHEDEKLDCEDVESVDFTSFQLGQLELFEDEIPDEQDKSGVYARFGVVVQVSSSGQLRGST